VASPALGGRARQLDPVNHYLVRVTLAGSHWLVDIPEFGRSVEARHLGEVEERAGELVTAVTGEAPGSFKLQIAHALH